MATVWRAYERSLDREVAIKKPQLPTDDPELKKEFVDRFLREARAAARLNHPGIVTIYSTAVHDEHPVIVMELIDGPTLSQVLKNGKLTARQTHAVMSQLLDAVGYAHTHGVVHRDLKPDNIFITREGSIKLADFGIAHVAASASLTRQGAALGTPAYMAPEQIKGHPTDARVDVFALGVIAYECLTGANPFGSASSTHYVTIINRIINEPIAPLATDDALAGPLTPVVAQALSKEPDDRFENATAMLAEWKRAFEVPVDFRAELLTLAGLAKAGIDAPAQPTAHWGANRPHGEDAVGLAADAEAAEDLPEVTDGPDVTAEAPEAVVAQAESDHDFGGDDDAAPAENSEAVALFEHISSEEPAEPDTPVEARPTSSKSKFFWAAAVLLGALIVGGMIAKAMRPNDTRVATASGSGVAVSDPSTQTTAPRISEATVESSTPIPPAATELKASSSKSSVTGAKSVTLKVAMSSAGDIEPGTKVKLQRKYPDGDWKTIETITLKDGKASHKTKVKRTSSYRFVFGGSETLAPSKSKSLSVKYKKPVVKRRTSPTRSPSTSSDVVIPPVEPSEDVPPTEPPAN